jgi:perosamine synthetase
VQKKQFWPDMVGFKYKMSNIQAAIGCGQMERIEQLISRKQTILTTYRQRLLAYDGLSMNPEVLGRSNGAWMPTVVFDSKTNITREKIQLILKTRNIDARVFFWPLSRLPVFGGVSRCPIAHEISERAINLPSYHEMTSGEQQLVMQTVVDALAE